MAERKSGGRGELSALLIVFPVWLLSALVLTTVSALFLNREGLTMRSVGLWSSGISFVSAALAGAAAWRMRKTGRVMTGLLCTLLLFIILISIGYIIKGDALEAAALISMCSFTAAGSLFGAVFCPDFSRKSTKFRKNFLHKM